MNKRDFFLHQMGIEQWQLRYPERLKGAIKIMVPNNIRLLIISEENIETHSALFKDILCSLNLDHTQWKCINLNQLQYLHLQHTALFWILSQQPQLELLAKHKNQIQSLWHSPNWSVFKFSAQAKRQLWQQIQKTSY